MYGVIIKESKGYFVPYTLQKFETSEHGKIKRIIGDEQCFTKAQKGELTSKEFLSYLGYDFPEKTMEDYLKKYLTLDENFKNFAEKSISSFISFRLEFTGCDCQNGRRIGQFGRNRTFSPLPSRCRSWNLSGYKRLMNI